MIELPIKSTYESNHEYTVYDIDFNYMQEHIKELEQERIIELEFYLKATGLSSCVLTDEDREILEKSREIDKSQNKEVLSSLRISESNRIQAEFCVDDLFTIETPKLRINANTVTVHNEPEGNPYVVRTSQNNGIRGYIKFDEQYLNPANTISFGQDTATMFYQERPYFTSDKIKILKLKFDKLNYRTATYLLASMRKAFSLFSWGQSKFDVDAIGGVKFWLPILMNDNNTPVVDFDNNHHPKGYIPDFEYMEKYIKAIQKQVITDVIKYKDDIISKTKKIVS